MKVFLKQVLLPTLLIAFLSISCKENNKTEGENILSLRKEYMNAWLSNDSVKIMNTITKDAVLIPHHGDMPIEGEKSIKEFWWPKDFSPSKVTLFQSTYDEVKTYNEIGYLRGRFKLHFDYENKKYSTEGNYLNIAKKTNEGWKFSHLIWNDPPTTVE